MGFFSNMLSEIKSLVKGAGDGSVKPADIESRLNAFKTLRSSLDLQWRKLEVEWKKASSVEGQSEAYAAHARADDAPRQVYSAADGHDWEVLQYGRDIHVRP